MDAISKSEDSRFILSSESLLRKIIREELTTNSKPPSRKELPRFINSDEFRELVGCSRSYEYKIRKGGRIPFRREGKTIKYLLSDVEKFIESSNKEGRS